MFIVFEGIDGSGKTTISNRVAKALRDDGLTIEHVREGGKFASGVTQAIRELGRDARNLDLSPHAELLLYAARDAQLLDEATRPALARADVVFADRFLYSAEVLARHGRGLSIAEVAPVIAGAARGVTPDLVILVDVDPHVARARRRIAKINVPDARSSSRKGLSGVGLQHRLRAGYRELAAADPTRWVVVENTEADLDEQVAHVTELVRAAVKGGPAAAVALARPTVRASHQPSPSEPQDANIGSRLGTLPAEPEAAVGAFLLWIDKQAAREPGLAMYFLAGMFGRGVDERRRALAAKVPDVAAFALRGLTDPVSWELRRKLAATAPRGVARSLGGLAGASEEGLRMRRELAAVAPAEIAATLDGRDDAESWALRDQLRAAAPDAVVQSVKRIGSARAWALRDEWLAEHGGDVVWTTWATAKIMCDSVNGVDGERAWAHRKAAREQAPVEALGSTAGLTDDKSWEWRQKYLPTATKIVMRTIAGSDDPRAWALREAALPRCKEGIDSLSGLDVESAWKLREAHADTWPSTVMKSVGPLARTPRGAKLVASLLSRHGDNVSLLKHAAAIALRIDGVQGGADEGWEA